MKKTILLYGLSLAVLTFLLKFLEYRFYIREISVEIYIGLIAAFFTVLGIWIGSKIIRKRQIPKPISGEFKINEEELKFSGISPREYEVLELMAQGFSNQEIADKLFVSLSTIKTHSANLFSKLNARRRTQAIQRAKELQLIP